MEKTTTLWVWFSLVIFLGGCINGGLSQGQGQEHVMKKTRSSAVVVGTVYCDTCFNAAFSKSPNHLIPDALVAVECINENSKPSFRQKVKTDEHGEFKVKLPFSVSKHVKNIKRCSVKLLSSSQPYCSIASSATASSLKRLKSHHHGENTQVFSAGFFTFKPETQPEICSQKPINSVQSKPLLPDPTFPPPIQDPPQPNPIPNLPLVPDLPLPKLPPLLPPSGPGPKKPASLPNKESGSLNDKKTEVLKPDFFFPPNPLNPPSVIPPNPLIPSIPTPSLPPNPLIPSPPTLPLVPSPPGLPPIPLVPSPSTPTLPPLPTIPTLPPGLPTVPGLPPVPVVSPVPPPAPPSFPIPLPPIPLIPGPPPALSHHKP